MAWSNKRKKNTMTCDRGEDIRETHAPMRRNITGCNCFNTMVLDVSYAQPPKLRWIIKLMGTGLQLRWKMCMVNKLLLQQTEPWYRLRWHEPASRKEKPADKATQPPVPAWTSTDWSPVRLDTGKPWETLQRGSNLTCVRQYSLSNTHFL